ncbi:MAG: tetratricopeptide repeat protein [Anaerolineaceae bacterium]|nr:tetratricopeptide repeat protein [Anaerolineaceae bacterium]
MYLKGSKWSMNNRRKRPNYFRWALLVALVGFLFYVNQSVLPDVEPLFIPTPTMTRAPESFLTEAQELLQEGKMSKAIIAFQEAIRSDPKNANLYITLARLQVFTGDYESAITNAENALLQSENNSMAHAVKGWALGLNSKYLEGEASLQKALEADPNNAMAYAFYSEVLILELMNDQGGIGTLDQAVEASRNAVALAPTTLETHRARGLVLEYTGNYDEAIYEFQQAININENIPDLHLALGRVYRSIGDYVNAIEEFNRANALNPSDPEPDLYSSRTYATTGDYTNAVQYAELAVKDDPTDPWLQANLGSMYYRKKDYPAAIPPLRLAIRGTDAANSTQLEPIALDYGRAAEYFYIYGLALARAGECGEGLQISQALQQGVPSDEIAIYNAQEIVNICQGVAQDMGTPTDTPAPEE